nr:sulfotransferase [Synechococcus sp. HK05]
MLRRSKSTRQYLRKNFYPLYRLSAPLRPLPNAVIIGGMKCGTTSLNAWLREHPGIAFSSHKEVHFFDKHFERGTGWYRTHFPIMERLQGASCTLEATPSYLYRAERVAPRMHALIPGAKLIVMLRNPVQRAISHYGHALRNQKESRPPEVALMSDFTSNGSCVNHYKSRGFYAKQLEHFLNFYPRNNILIIKSEEFFSAPSTIYQQTLNFLNLERRPLPDNATARNTSTIKPVISDAVRQHLEIFYEQPNQDLSALLGDFPGW